MMTILNYYYDHYYYYDYKLHFPMITNIIIVCFITSTISIQHFECATEMDHHDSVNIP